MNYHYNPGENERIPAARESFSGRILTNRQFDEALVVTHIIENEIHRSGAFKEKLGDYAYAMARNQKFDASKADSILRDIFKERTGQTMNELRTSLMENAEKLTDEQRQTGYQYASDIGPMMESGNKISFNRAAAHQAQEMAREFGITDNAARSIMAEEFEAVEGQSLWEWGKELDEHLFKPQIEAEMQERGSVQQSRSRSPSREARPQRGAHAPRRTPAHSGPSR